jgi:hypothetical protein
MIDREGSRAVAVTNPEGEATFTDLRPGIYSISAEADGYLPVERKVDVGSIGCVEVRLGMMLDRRIKGRVLTSDGHPAADVQIQVRSIERPVWDEAQSVKTDADGNYEFRYFIQPGGYHVGVNLDHPPTLENPYTRWFSPGTDNPQTATPVYFADVQETKQYDLVLPSRQKERLIQGTVITPDGQPVAGALVSILDAQWLWRPAVVETRADSNGQFVLQALDAVRYRLHAVASVTGIGPRPFASAFPKSAEPMDVMPGKEPVSARLVITRQGDSVREDRQRGFNQR